MQGLRQVSHLEWTVLAASSVILVAVIFILQQFYAYQKSAAFERALDLNNKVALSDEVRVRSLLATLDKVMLALRREFANNPKMGRQQLQDVMDALKVDRELNPRISFIDASGDVILSSASPVNDPHAKINVADREYFRRAKIDPKDVLRVEAPIESRIVGKWVLPLTRPIVNESGSLGGMVVLTIDPALFTEALVNVPQDADAARAIVGLDGIVRLRLVAGRLSFGGDASALQVFNEIENAKVGSYTAVIPVDGVRRLVSYRVVEPFAIIILAGTSVESIDRAYADRVRGYSITAALFGLLILVLSGLLRVGIVRQRKLLESRQSFDKLIELVPQLVSRLDVHGNIIWVNSRTVEYVGPSAEAQAEGFYWVLAAVHPEDQERVRGFLNASLQRGQNAPSCEYRKRRSDGAYLWFSSQITQVLDNHGAVASYLQTGTDIHDRKMVDERTRVTQKLEAIGQLTGGMAHDFNNLLAIILGNLELLKPQLTNQTDLKRLEVAIGAGQRGVGVVKSLLALASKQPLLPTRMDVWELVERISPLLKHALGQRVHFVLRPPAFPVEVVVDEAGLEAVLLNLIVNARDAMPKGGNLILSLGVSEEAACITVEDTGVGMSEAVLKRVTEPFFTTKERGHGTGLGLSMVAGFVKQSGGKMHIQSAEGKGTQVQILLPLATSPKVREKTPFPVIPRAAPAPDPTPTPVPTSAPTRAVASAVKHRILVVDDEIALAELVRTWARGQGYNVALVHSAEDALTLLAVRPFDVLLTDIVMPGELDGIGLAEKAHVRYPALKILLMSGYSNETSTNLGDIPWPLLVKPFTQEVLFAALAQAIQGP